MIFTASDVESLSRSLGRWEIAEYVCAGLVTVACAGEFIADFTDWFTRGVKEKKVRLAKGSTLLLIASLALELVCLVKTNSLSGRLIGSLSDKAAAADTKAQSALEASGKAQDKADAIAKQANDLLKKYGEAESDLTALKAKSLPRRLSSAQKVLLRKRSARFATKSIFVSCVNGGIETFDFEQDFVSVFRRPELRFKLQFQSSCSQIVAPGVNPPPVQVEAGADRQRRKDIVSATNTNKSFLALTIGPKPL
jgi:hypothetical protein